MVANITPRQMPFGAFGRTCFAIALTSGIGGCATASLEGDSSLSSYSNLQSSDGVLAKSRLYVSAADVAAARTVKIMPTTFSPKAEVEGVNSQQRKLIANAISRTLCINLSDKYTIVASGEADLVVRARVTEMKATDEGAVVASRGGAIAKAVLLPGVPAPVPRVPYGLGSLSVEAEARDRSQHQVAAMVWGRGANAFLGSGRVSTSGDAYDLTGSFSEDFSTMLITVKTPYGTMTPTPSFERLQALAGGQPKYEACEVFGRAPGVAGFLGGAVGAPPEWHDKGGADTVAVATQAPEQAR